jgi:hypothetical protein
MCLLDATWVQLFRPKEDRVLTNGHNWGLALTQVERWFALLSKRQIK